MVVMATTENPHPDVLPTHRRRNCTIYATPHLLVCAISPNVLDSQCDAWGYESGVGVFQTAPEVGPDAPGGYSRDRYITTVMGAVSYDGKYLTAIANDSADAMHQYWHCCFHNNPQWLPLDAPTAERRWRVKVYAMENDPDALLARVGKDFPNAKHVHPTEAAPVDAGRGLPVYTGPGVDLTKDSMDANGNILNRPPSDILRDG